MFWDFFFKICLSAEKVNLKPKSKLKSHDIPTVVSVGQGATEGITLELAWDRSDMERLSC